MPTTSTTDKPTIRFTVDLPLSLHLALTALAEQKQRRKATLVRIAIARLSLKDDIGDEALLSEVTKRFTLDMEPSEHENLSILAIRMRRKKAELVRWAIAQLLQDTQDNALVQ